MRALVLAAIALLVLPAVARAAGPHAVTRELAPAGRTLLTRTAPMRFDLAGVSSRGAGTVEFRVRGMKGWSAWHAARPEPAHSIITRIDTAGRERRSSSVRRRGARTLPSTVSS